jgi:hypothetical protein
MAEVQIVQNPVRVISTAVGHRVVGCDLRALRVRALPRDLVLASAGQVVDNTVILGVTICFLAVYFAILRVA